MTQAKIKLYIVDGDSIFLLGLRTAIANYADFEIVGSGNLSEDTLRRLTQGMVLNVLVLGIGYGKAADFGWELTKKLRELYPELPLFLLTPNFSGKQLGKLRSLGVRGSCDRTVSINTMVEGLYTVAYGDIYWNTDETATGWQKLLARVSRGGRQELEQTLEEIVAKLDNPNLSDWERVFLVGRKRELESARWLSSRLVGSASTFDSQSLAIEPTPSPIVPIASTELTPLPEFAASANQSLFERVATEIQLGLLNRTKIPLEIDILQVQCQKNLCHLILKRLSDTVTHIPIANTLDRNYDAYLKELWQWSTDYFFSQSYGQLMPEEQDRLQTICDREWKSVSRNVLTDICGLPELFDYLQGKPGIIIDNVRYQSDDAEAITRIEFLLCNLLIHLANAVMQVILNNFYDLEVLKYRLYRSSWRSDRELARFRNQLDWRYRQETYLIHPQNIFESRYRLFVLNGGAIRIAYIYAPRQQELERLTGIPWLSTMIIEVRDAIAPLVRQLIALTGSGVVFVLTQVIGKGLGLIGKGIVQGIGSTIKDIPQNKKKP